MQITCLVAVTAGDLHLRSPARSGSRAPARRHSPTNSSAGPASHPAHPCRRRGSTMTEERHGT